GVRHCGSHRLSLAGPPASIDELVDHSLGRGRLAPWATCFVFGLARAPTEGLTTMSSSFRFSHLTSLIFSYGLPVCECCCCTGLLVCVLAEVLGVHSGAALWSGHPPKHAAQHIVGR